MRPGHVRTLLASLFFAPAAFGKIAPKVMIVSMFINEQDAWWGIPEFNVLEKNITVPGLSPIFPQIHCTKNTDICQVTTGEGEINAASTLTALLYSKKFDLTSTYWLIAGIAGVNPKVATIGSVTFARYAVHVGLQYEIDARQMPSNFSTGYFPQGSSQPGVFPPELYGTEVFEVNEPLRQIAYHLAKNATLADNDAARAQRRLYAATPGFAAGGSPAGVGVYLCDTATSDQYWDGSLLGEAFENTTSVWTNGTGVYCTTQQEDNATLEALLRGTLAKLTDYSRVIIMRTASDFDRAPAGESTYDSLTGDTPGFGPSILNLHLAGVKVVEAIVGDWHATYKKGIKATNYIGDAWGSLGGQPDFGPGSIFGGKGAFVDDDEED